MKICVLIFAAIAGFSLAYAQEAVVNDVPAVLPNSKPTVATKVQADTHLCTWPSRQILTSAVRLTVDKDGNPQHVSLAHSSGNSCLDKAALTAVRTYKFRPATDKQGAPVSASISLLEDFQNQAERVNGDSSLEASAAFARTEDGRKQTTLAGTPVYLVAGAVKPPKVLYTADPEYSSSLPRGTGVVLIGLVVTEQGTLENVRVLNSSDERLDKAALDAARSYRFAPTTLDGKPVAVKLQVDIPFSINR
jgi:protein TonB